MRAAIEPPQLHMEQAILSPTDQTPNILVSTPDESLIFFILRLLERMREMGTAPAADLMEYGRSLRSFRK
jgi:hypothetical protein